MWLLTYKTESSPKEKTRRKKKIDLLTFLIEKRNQEQNTFKDTAPIELLKCLMKENKIKAAEKKIF